MPKPQHVFRELSIPKGYASREAGSFVAQLDELSGRMFADLAHTSAADLGWQPGPGHNTIGMLLAHCAIVEVFWLPLTMGTATPERLTRVLGLSRDDDGIPLPQRGRPPAALRGCTLSEYRRLHDRARTHTHRLARKLGPAGLERCFEHVQRNGTRSTIRVRWVLYHLLEHQAGHYGQMLMLLHQRKDGPRAKR